MVLNERFNAVITSAILFTVYHRYVPLALLTLLKPSVLWFSSIILFFQNQSVEIHGAFIQFKAFIIRDCPRLLLWSSVAYCWYSTI